MDHKNLLTRHASPTLWQGGIRLFAMKVFTTFYRRMFLMIRPLDATIPSLRPRLPVVVKMLAEKDLPAYNSFRPDQCTNLIQTRLARGEQCFAVWYAGRIVHAAFYQPYLSMDTGRVYVPYLHRDLILQQGDVYSHDGLTLPAYRGYGLSPARGAHAMHHYWQEGYKRVVCLITVENRPQLRAIQKMGHQSVGLYSCLRFGPWQHDWQQMWSEAPLPRLAETA